MTRTRGRYSAQAIAFYDAKPKRLNILQGAVRSGKTFISNLTAIRKRIPGAPRGDIIITGKTERTAYRNVVRPLQEAFGERYVRYSKGAGEGSIGGRTFYAVGANNELAENKIRGLTVAYWLADELTLYPESFVTQGLARMSPEGACADWTMNPGSPMHYVKVNYIDREAELDARAWHFLLEHNPNLPKSYVENLKREYGGLSTLYYQRYIDGLWVLAEGTIYDFFDKSIHVIPGPPCRADYYTISVDYGTGNATTFQLHGHMNQPMKIAPFTGLQCWLEAEYYWDSREPGKGQKTDEEYAEDFKLFVSTFVPNISLLRLIIIDPSAASFRLALIKKDYRQIKNARNAVVDGIRTQARMLKSGAYKVCASAKQAIKDYAAYVWDEKAQARGEDAPVKANDHSKDAERYNLHTIYGRSIQN